MPIQDRLWLEQENLTQLRLGTPSDLLELNEQDRQETLFPAAGPSTLTESPLQHAQLLPQQQNFQVFVRRLPARCAHIDEKVEDHRHAIPNHSHRSLSITVRRWILAGRSILWDSSVPFPSSTRTWIFPPYGSSVT